ncbi:hypothetical protein ACFFK7_10370 [Pseudoalteromonas xiamenensis]|uniref:hypothetical protein n=1 Tax=Pseudoalteromonas xiamenensis TaxID=882626 RepID=UPI0035E9070B
MITKEEAMANLPYIEDKAIYQAVSLALWLLIDKGRPLKASVDIAAGKFTARPKVGIERLIREVVPAEFFAERQAPVKKTIGHRNQRMDAMTALSDKHMASIATEPDK